MNNKSFVVFAVLCTIISADHVHYEEHDVQQPDELYILNPGSAFPFIVTDPNSPILSMDRRQVICIASQCDSFCRSRGYRQGRCHQAICVCTR